MAVALLIWARQRRHLLRGYHGGTKSLMAPLLGAAVFSAALGRLPAALRALTRASAHRARSKNIRDREEWSPSESPCAAMKCTPQQARSCWTRRSVTRFQGVSCLV